MADTIRWSIVVSDTDQALRMFLANQGESYKGDISRFVEEAVRSHSFDLTAAQVKEMNAKISEQDLTAILDNEPIPLKKPIEQHLDNSDFKGGLLAFVE